MSFSDLLKLREKESVNAKSLAFLFLVTLSVFLVALVCAPNNASASQDSSNESIPSIDWGYANPYSLIFQPSSSNVASSDENSTSTDANLSATRVGQRAMYRLYNKWSGEHFYTCDETERDGLVKIGWTNESIGWVAPKTSSTPVYRLYNKYVVGGDHHYTISASERDSLKKAGWTYEGVGWYSVDKGTLYRTPAYRQYNPQPIFMQSQLHNRCKRKEHAYKSWLER
jgi:hypothetical protein